MAGLTDELMRRLSIKETTVRSRAKAQSNTQLRAPAARGRSIRGTLLTSFARPAEQRATCVTGEQSAVPPCAASFGQRAALVTAWPQCLAVLSLLADSSAHNPKLTHL